MEIFKIVKDNKKSLREKSVPYELPLDEETIQLGKDMLTYLKISQDDALADKYHLRAGVGLAAPQIGVNKQMIAIYVQGDHGKNHEFVLVNPKIVSESAKLCYLSGGEGCLSVDKPHKGLVYRHYRVTVRAYNVLKGKEEDIVLNNFLAIVAQHEIDHLSGKLFYDRINPIDPFKRLPGAVEI